MRIPCVFTGRLRSPPLARRSAKFRARLRPGIASISVSSSDFFLRLVQESLGINGPLFTSRLPGKLTRHVGVEALQQGEAVFVVVVEPAGKVDPIPIMAGMYRAKLNIIVAPDDIRITLARLEGFARFYALAKSVDDAQPEVSRFVEDNDLRMLKVIIEAGRI